MLELNNEEKFWLEQPKLTGRGRLGLPEENDIAAGADPLLNFKEGEAPDEVTLEELEIEALHGDPLAQYVLKERARKEFREGQAPHVDVFPTINTEDPAVDCFETVDRDHRFKPAFDSLTNRAYNPNIGKNLINYEPTPQPVPLGRLAQRKQRLAEMEQRAIRWVSVTELAALCGVNRATIITAIERQELSATRTSPKGMYRINAKLAVPPYLAKCGYSDTAIKEVLGEIDRLYGND